MKTHPTLVICDDDPLFREAITRTLRTHAFVVHPAVDGPMCERLLTTQHPDLAIVDLALPGQDGAEVIRRARERGDPVPVIVVSGRHLTGPRERELHQLGVAQVLLKPLSPAALIGAARGALVAAAGPRTEFEFAGTSEAVRALVKSIDEASEAHHPVVLLTGEPGTGRHRAARRILARSNRRDRRPNSSHYIHEIATLDLRAQAAWWQAIRSANGPEAPKWIASTRYPIATLAADGRLIRPLYDLLHEVSVRFPTLEERPEDLESLVTALSAEVANELDVVPPLIEAEDLGALRFASWPGNVAELKAVVERWMFHRRLSPALALQDALGTQRHLARSGFLLPEQGIRIEDVERDLLHQALRRTHGNQVAAARLLGISRYALRYRLKKTEPEPE